MTLMHPTWTLLWRIGCSQPYLLKQVWQGLWLKPVMLWLSSFHYAQLVNRTTDEVYYLKAPKLVCVQYLMELVLASAPSSRCSKPRCNMGMHMHSMIERQCLLCCTLLKCFAVAHDSTAMLAVPHDSKAMIIAPHNSNAMFAVPRDSRSRLAVPHA